MKLYPAIFPGIFLNRLNRFVAKVSIDGVETLCHVKNTGRCRELLVPGASIWCQKQQNPQRKTGWSLITVQKGTRLFNLDSQVPNLLAFQWVADGGLGVIPEQLRREQSWGSSRLDLAFILAGRPCLMEVKGVTLEENGIARFPDAPTVRGVKHLLELQRAVENGFNAYLLFVCQMEGVLRVEPNRNHDPEFAKTLALAADHGVQILAAECMVTPNSIAISKTVPVLPY